jgi:hypothetical protein
MRRMLISMVSLVLFIASLSLGAQKAREWQTGKVLDSQESSSFAGTVGSANTTAQANGNYGTTNTSQAAVYRVYQNFLIEGPTHAYLVQQFLRWRWSKAANLTVNAPVKFAVEKRKLFLIDEDGKEHQMEIIKRILRLPVEQPKPSK